MAEKGRAAAAIGGQAVIEGVMMRGKRHWALAVRKPDGEIVTHSEPLNPLADRYPVLRLPVLRGMIGLWESMSLGIKTLMMSANESLDEGEQEISKKEMALSLTLGIGLAIGLFFILPLFAASPVKRWFPDSSAAFVIAEGILRVVILVIYILVVSLIPHLRRVFEYHGAEHKSIHAFEAGVELNPFNVARYTPLHPRCGTSFLLIVMVVAIIAFSFVPIPSDWTNIPYLLLFIASRIIGIPLIVGLSYEVIKYAGRHKDSTAMRVIMFPGLMLQRLTTRQPDPSQIEVAIRALERVLELEPVEVDETGKADVEVMA